MRITREMKTGVSYNSGIMVEMQMVCTYRPYWGATSPLVSPSFLAPSSRSLSYNSIFSVRRCRRCRQPMPLTAHFIEPLEEGVHAAVKCRSTSDDIEETQAHTSPLQSKQSIKYMVAAALSAACCCLFTSSNVGMAFRNSVMSSWLGQSGFVAALSLIFLSEIGDKTFFICAILAMRLGRWISFCGTVVALSFMTLFSVGLGVAFNAIPDAMRTSIPVGKYLSVALLFFFGVRSILNGMQSPTASESFDELADAEETVANSEELKLGVPSGDQGHGLRGRLRSVAVVTALIFVAEWGDRSMLTTIALGASQNPLGVALGGIVGHTAAALIAITGGSLISKVISENSVHFISGILFVIFAAATALNWM